MSCYVDCGVWNGSHTIRKTFYDQKTKRPFYKIETKGCNIVSYVDSNRVTSIFGIVKKKDLWWHLKVTNRDLTGELWSIPKKFHGELKKNEPVFAEVESDPLTKVILNIIKIPKPTKPL